MTRPTTVDELNEILLELANNYVKAFSPFEAQLDGSINATDAPMLYKAKQTLTQFISNEMKAVIGEDEDTEADAKEALDAGVAVTSGKMLGKIELRAEQRTTAKNRGWHVG